MAGKRRKRNTTSLILIILLMSTIMAGLLVYIGFDDYIKGVVRLKGNWIREVDITNDVVAETALYLSDVQGINIDTAYIRQYVKDIKVSSTLTFGDSGSKSFREQIDEESYNLAREKVYLAVSNEMQDIMLERMRRMDIDTTDISMEELEVSTLGTSLYSYLSKCDIRLMPTYEELNAQYGTEGTYSIGKDTIKFADQQRLEEHLYIVDNNDLLLFKNGMYETYSKETKG